MKTVLVLTYRSYMPLFEALSHSASATFVVHFLEDVARVGAASYLAKTIHDVKAGILMIDGVIGLVEGGVALAAILRYELRMIGPSFDSILACQNKYVSRVRQASCIGLDNVTFHLDDEVSHFGDTVVSFPRFAKAVHSSLSAAAFVADSVDDCKRKIAILKPRVVASNALYRQVVRLGYFADEYVHKHSNFIVEDILAGELITVDGYVHGSEVTCIGITRSVMLDGTLSFTRFDYPYSFGKELDTKIYDCIVQFVTHLGLNTSAFNIELMIDRVRGNVSIVEIHARFSLQFLPLFQRVVGRSMLDLWVEITCGINPKFSQKRGSTYALCSSCILREREDCFVISSPGERELCAVQQRFPDVHVLPLACAGSKLSDYRQDTATYRYAILTIPGSTVADIEHTRSEVASLLGYQLQPIFKMP